MFAPTKTWRKWHVKVNQAQRRFAVVSALAASALPSLVNSMPECAEPCFQKVGVEIGCDTTDLKCMCSQDDSFKAHFGTCAQKDCFAYLFDRQ